MTEKYRKVINKPIEKLHKAKKAVREKNAPTKSKKVLKASALAGMTLTEFMMRFAKFAVLDNKLLRKLEKRLSEIKVGKDKDGHEKKFQAFIKKNPNLSAVAIWWAMFAMLIGGGAGLLSKSGKKTDKSANQYVEQTDEDDVFQIGTYGAYFERLNVITPLLIIDLIAKEGVHVNEDGMHTPYQDSRGIWTIGFGSTVLKDGSKVTEHTPPITTEEAYELARWHLEEGETYFCMYCYDVAYGTVDINDVGQAFAMGSIIYNSYTKLIEDPENKECKERFTTLRKLYNEYGYGVTNEMVQEVFDKYPVVAPRSFGKAWLGGAERTEVADKLGGFLAGGQGLYWRRWLEAGLLTGEITPQMLLDCPLNGMFEFFKCKGRQKNAFFTRDKNGDTHVNRDTYEEFREWIKSPVNEKGQSLAGWQHIRDCVPEYALAACNGDVCELGAKAPKQQRIYQKQVSRKTYVINYTNAYQAAVASYKAGDYELAAHQFEVLLVNNPQNALLHNDLAATYNRLGRYDDAILHAQKIVLEIGDKTQYAAAQYNAGFAYEQKGNLRKALANYKLSVANGNRRVQKDVERVTNKINNTNSKTTSAKLQVAMFNEAAARVKNKTILQHNNVAQFDGVEI